MVFTSTPLDGSTTPIPMSSAVPDGTNTPLAIAGGPSYTDTGNPKVPVSMYVKDGNDVAQGTSTDANTANSVIGRLTKIRDLLNAALSVSVTNANANGQAIMGNSSPVVIASDQSSVPVKGNFVEIAGAGTGVVTGTSTDFIASTDVSAYKWLSLHITGTATLTLTFQGSNDNVNFASIIVSRSDTASALNTGSTAAIAGATNVMYTGAITYRYLRVRCTTFTSNASMAGNLELFTQTPAYALAVGQVAQSGTWTVQPGNTPNTTPWLITHANNNASVPTGAANTVIKNAAGEIATLVVTTTGAGAGNVQIFDNASTNTGTVLFAFPATVNAGTSYLIYGWAKVGMTAQNVASGPVFTVFYA